MLCFPSARLSRLSPARAQRSHLYRTRTRDRTAPIDHLRQRYAAIGLFFFIWINIFFDLSKRGACCIRAVVVERTGIYISLLLVALLASCLLIVEPSLYMLLRLGKDEAFCCY